MVVTYSGGNQGIGSSTRSLAIFLDPHVDWAGVGVGAVVGALVGAEVVGVEVGEVVVGVAVGTVVGELVPGSGFEQKTLYEFPGLVRQPPLRPLYHRN